jgi:hypothetical protein
LDAIDATAWDIIERSLENCSAWPQSIAIAWNSGGLSSAVLARTQFAVDARNFPSVGVRPAGLVSGVTSGNINGRATRTLRWEVA